MSLPLSWGQIVLKVQNSGIQQLQKQINDHKKRNMLLRADWQNQIQQSSTKKRMQEEQKLLLRAHAEMIDAKAYQKQKRLKSEAKQRESVYKNKNMEMIEQHRQTKKGQFQNKYGQNPLTSSMSKGYEEREKKSREQNKEFNLINNKLIEQKELLKKITFNLESIQRKRFQNYVEQTFKRKDDQRYAFKRACLDGRKKKAQTFATPNTVHDSLEKEYATYLNGQIAEKKSLGQSQMIYSRIKVNQTQLKNIHKMNSKVEEQNSSPAYLGRIPLSHDRQKQLNYLDKQLRFRQRIKTQNASISFIENPQQMKVSQLPQMDEHNHRSQNRKQYGSNIPYKNNQIQIKHGGQTNKKSDIKQYRQLNILTGSHIIRSHYL